MEKIRGGPTRAYLNLAFPLALSFFFFSFPFLSTAHPLGEPRSWSKAPATEPAEVEVLRPSD